MRGPYRAVAIFTTVLMLIGGFALMPIAAGAQPAEDKILEAVPEGDSVEFLGEQFEFDEATVPAEAPPKWRNPRCRP